MTPLNVRDIYTILWRDYRLNERRRKQKLSTNKKVYVIVETTQGMLMIFMYSQYKQEMFYSSCMFFSYNPVSSLTTSIVSKIKVQ